MKKRYIKIWGDVVDGKELLLSTLIIAITTMGAFFLAPVSKTLPLNLFFGLGGAIIGSVITALLFKPKRKITKES